jgi:hypothetical protein
MRIQLTQATILAATLAGTAAYVNVAPATNRKPAFSRQASATALEMARSSEDNKNPMTDLTNGAMSLFTASAFAFAAATTVLPAAPAMAAVAEKPAVEQGQKAAPGVTTSAPSAKKKMSEKEQEKIKMAKMSSAEREQYSAKKNLDLSAKTVVEYQKYLTMAKTNDGLATKAVQAAEKAEIPARKAFLAASDKLTAAKSQAMPSSAIKELSEKVGTAKSTLQVAEKHLAESNKASTKMTQEIKYQESNVKSAQESQQRAKKTLEKADKNLKKYNKKLEKEQKQAAKKKAQQVKEQETKIDKLKKETQKYESIKASSEKEAAAKKAQIDAELKALDKLKK